MACFWGYFHPAAGEFLSRRLSLLLACLMFFLGMGIGFRRFRTRLNAWNQIAVVMAITYLVAPLLAFGIATLFFSEQLIVYTGIILIGTTSTTLSTCVIFTRLAGGDEALALWLSVFSSLLCSFVSPILLYWFLGGRVEVPVGMMINRLLLVLMFPLSAGMLVRSGVGEAKVSSIENILTRVCAIIILSVIMVSVAKGRSYLTGANSLPIIAAVGGFHLVLLSFSKLVTDQFNFTRGEKIATLFCSSQKALQIPAYLAIVILDTPVAALAPVVHHVFQLTIDSLIISYYSSRSGES